MKKINYIELMEVRGGLTCEPGGGCRRKMCKKKACKTGATSDSDLCVESEYTTNFILSQDYLTE